MRNIKKKNSTNLVHPFSKIIILSEPGQVIVSSVCRIKWQIPVFFTWIQLNWKLWLTTLEWTWYDSLMKLFRKNGRGGFVSCYKLYWINWKGILNFVSYKKTFPITSHLGIRESFYYWLGDWDLKFCADFYCWELHG